MYSKLEEFFGKVKKIQYRRYFIPFLALNYYMSIKKNYNNYYFLAISTFLNSLIILGNFTFIVTWTNAKPLYYEDIYIDSKKLPLIELDDKRKQFYRKYYTRILVFSNSLLISALICYWKSKVGSISSYIEIIGVTGGLIEIAACFNNLTGKLAIFFIRKIIKIQIASQNSIEYDTESDYNSDLEV